MKCNHNFEVVFDSENYYGEHKKVKWCSTCGAVTIDVEVDGRCYPGRVMDIRLPKNSKE